MKKSFEDNTTGCKSIFPISFIEKKIRNPFQYRQRKLQIRKGLSSLSIVWSRRFRSNIALNAFLLLLLFLRNEIDTIPLSLFLSEGRTITETDGSIDKGFKQKVIYMRFNGRKQVCGVVNGAIYGRKGGKTSRQWNDCLRCNQCTAPYSRVLFLD